MWIFGFSNSPFRKQPKTQPVIAWYRHQPKRPVTYLPRVLTLEQRDKPPLEKERVISYAEAVESVLFVIYKLEEVTKKGETEVSIFLTSPRYHWTIAKEGELKAIRDVQGRGQGQWEETLEEALTVREWQEWKRMLKAL